MKSSEFELIRFDKKVNVYIGLCLFFFFLFVALKWHNSSIPFWSANINDGGSQERGLVAGRPVPIRSDEWLVVSSFIMAQEQDHYPVSNEALGYGKTPLVMGLPTNSILSILRPQLWGYYLLDDERAFSWQWNFKIFPFLIVSFLLLMLFTKNNFLISLFGSTWLFLSSAIQWWSINTEIFTLGFITVISGIYILYSNKINQIILNGIIFLISCFSFAMILYPPYQVPLAYFLLALFLGFIISRKNLGIIVEMKFVKLSVFACCLVLLSLLFYKFYKECKGTIEVMSHTVYPGGRNEQGGGFSFVSMFRDNFSWFLNDSFFPPRWGNICELSSFMVLSPIVTILVLFSYFKTRKINPLFVPLLAFNLIIWFWLFKGFPPFLSKLSLLSASPPTRTFFVFGFSNVVFTLLYLGQYKKAENVLAITKNKALAFAAIFILAFVINYRLNKQADRYFSIHQIINATIIFAALNWLIVYYKESKVFQYLFVSCCFFFVCSNIFINPLSKGLSPFLENKVYNTVSKINDKDPNAGWIVFGNMIAADMVKATGANCFNGVQFAPPLEKLHILDPSGKDNAIYNRYAHIVVDPLTEGEDSVHFALIGADQYQVQVDPCSPRLKQMGIKYVMFNYKPPEEQVNCMLPVTDTCGFFIYKRKDL